MALPKRRQFLGHRKPAERKRTREQRPRRRDQLLKMIVQRYIVHGVHQQMKLLHAGRSFRHNDKPERVQIIDRSSSARSSAGAIPPSTARSSLSLQPVIGTSVVKLEGERHVERNSSRSSNGSRMLT